MGSTIYEQIRQKKLIKLFESLSGKKIINESFIAYLDNLSKLRNNAHYTGDLADAIKKISNTELSLTPSRRSVAASEAEAKTKFENAIKKIEENLPGGSTKAVKQFLKDQQIALDIKAKYFEHISNRQGDLAAQLIRDNLPSVRRPIFGDESQNPRVVTSPGRFGAQVFQRRLEAGVRWTLDASRSISDLQEIPMNSNLKTMFDNIAGKSSVGKPGTIIQVSDVEGLKRIVAQEIAGGKDAYDALVAQAKSRFNLGATRSPTAQQLIEVMTPDQVTKLNLLMDYLIPVAKRHKLVYERTTSLFQLWYSDPIRTAAGLPRQAGWFGLKFLLGSTKYLLYDVAFFWVVPLKPTQYGWFPWLTSMSKGLAGKLGMNVDGRTVSAKANIIANIILGLLEPTIVQSLLESVTGAKEFMDIPPPPEDTSIPATELDENELEKTEFLASHRLLLENWSQIEAAANVIILSGGAVRYAAGEVTKLGIVSYFFGDGDSEGIKGTAARTQMSPEESLRFMKELGRSVRIRYNYKYYLLPSIEKTKTEINVKSKTGELNSNQSSDYLNKLINTETGIKEELKKEKEQPRLKKKGATHKDRYFLSTDTYHTYKKQWEEVRDAISGGPKSERKPYKVDR